MVRDPTPDTPENEFRDELMERYRYANAHLAGWDSDAGRVYILYGPPANIQDVPMIKTQTSIELAWKSAEVWEYDRPSGGNQIPVLLAHPALIGAPFPSPGKMFFVFARKSIVGRLVQVYSTEPGEAIAPAILR